MNYKVKILFKEFVTHDVKSFILEKPEGYSFIPGQATDVAINKLGLENEKRPFTFTSLQEDNVLQFTIKGYFDRDGITRKIHELNPGDELLIGEPWGSINYSGIGTFIAGGAGITPFIAIFRMLKKQGLIKNNKLFFSNKTHKDIIYKYELEDIFSAHPENLKLFLTRENINGFESGRITEYLLRDTTNDLAQKFYICGPSSMVNDLTEVLTKLGANVSSIIFEK